VIDCNDGKTEKRHQFTNMGKLKRLELWRRHMTALAGRTKCQAA